METFNHFKLFIHGRENLLSLTQSLIHLCSRAVSPQDSAMARVSFGELKPGQLGSEILLWGKEVLCFVSCTVGSWGVGGPCGVPSPVELSTCGMSWFLDEVKRSKHYPHPEAGGSAAFVSGNGRAVGNGSVCVSLTLSGSSKIYEGPHPLLSMHCVP